MFEKLSSVATLATGSTPAFILALSVIVAWLVSGPLFNFSDTWQLVINTGTTIITFLMVFLIQRSQNKDSIAIHLKLNELILAHELANNRLVSVEDISEAELKVLRKFYSHLAMMAKKEISLEESHSLKEAAASHEWKQKNRRGRSRHTNTK
jgi:low affinity Fe/Cu permease